MMERRVRCAALLTVLCVAAALVGGILSPSPRSSSAVSLLDFFRAAESILQGASESVPGGGSRSSEAVEQIVALTTKDAAAAVVIEWREQRNYAVSSGYLSPGWCATLSRSSDQCVLGTLAAAKELCEKHADCGAITASSDQFYIRTMPLKGEYHAGFTSWTKGEQAPGSNKLPKQKASGVITRPPRTTPPRLLPWCPAGGKTHITGSWVKGAALTPSEFQKRDACVKSSNGCTCLAPESPNRRGERLYDAVWQPRNCRLTKWNAARFCTVLGNRTILFLGDSTGAQSYAAVRNALQIGGASPTCVSRITEITTDTLIGMKFQSGNRGPPWRESLEKEQPDIAILSAMAHIIPQDGPRDAPYYEIVEDLVKGAAAFEQRGMRLVWKTANPGGCTKRGHVLHLGSSASDSKQQTEEQQLSAENFLGMFDEQITGTTVQPALATPNSAATYPLHIWKNDVLPRAPFERSIPWACASMPGKGSDCGWDRFPRRDAWTVDRLANTSIEVMDVRPLYMRGDAYVELVPSGGDKAFSRDCLHQCNSGHDPLVGLIPPLLMHMLEMWQVETNTASVQLPKEQRHTPLSILHNPPVVYSRNTGPPLLNLDGHEARRKQATSSSSSSSDVEEVKAFRMPIAIAPSNAFFRAQIYSDGGALAVPQACDFEPSTRGAADPPHSFIAAKSPACFHSAPPSATAVLINCEVYPEAAYNAAKIKTHHHHLIEVDRSTLPVINGTSTPSGSHPYRGISYAVGAKVVVHGPLVVHYAEWVDAPHHRHDETYTLEVAMWFDGLTERADWALYRPLLQPFEYVASGELTAPGVPVSIVPLPLAPFLDANETNQKFARCRGDELGRWVGERYLPWTCRYEEKVDVAKCSAEWKNPSSAANEPRFRSRNRTGGNKPLKVVHIGASTMSLFLQGVQVAMGGAPRERDKAYEKHLRAHPGQSDNEISYQT